MVDSNYIGTTSRRDELKFDHNIREYEPTMYSFPNLKNRLDLNCGYTLTLPHFGNDQLVKE